MNETKKLKLFLLLFLKFDEFSNLKKKSRRTAKEKGDKPGEAAEF